MITMTSNAPRLTEHQKSLFNIEDGGGRSTLGRPAPTLDDVSIRIVDSRIDADLARTQLLEQFDRFPWMLQGMREAGIDHMFVSLSDLTGRRENFRIVIHPNRNLGETRIKAMLMLRHSYAALAKVSLNGGKEAGDG